MELPEVQTLSEWELIVFVIVFSSPTLYKFFSFVIFQLHNEYQLINQGEV